MEQDNKLAKFLDNTLSEVEKAEMLADPDHEIYQKIKQYSSQLSIPEEDIIEEPLLAQILDSPKRQVEKVRSIYRYGWWGAIAAVFLLLLAAAGYVRLGEEIFTAGAMANVQVQLPDASAVDLRKNSTLSFNNVSWAWQRVTKLTGEAYFEVEKGSVFTVETSLGLVKVVGTRFDVSNRAGHFEVNCYHGKVKVTHEGSSMIIQEGESLNVVGDTWNRDSLFLKEPIWRSGKMVFRSSSLQSVLHELSNTYKLQIAAKANSIANGKQFSGVLPFDDKETAIQIIEKAFAVAVIRVAENRYEVIAK